MLLPVSGRASVANVCLGRKFRGSPNQWEHSIFMSATNQQLTPIWGGVKGNLGRWVKKKQHTTKSSIETKRTLAYALLLRLKAIAGGAGGAGGARPPHADASHHWQ